jgi:hypothetical protein
VLKALVPAESSEEALPRAWKITVASLVCILLIWAFVGLSLQAVVFGPVFGLLALASLVAYWRTKIDWLSGLPFSFVGLLTPIVLSNSGLWSVIAGVVIAALFQYLPLWIFGKSLADWASRGHS